MAGKTPDSQRSTHATEFVKGDWDRAQYLTDPHVDNMMACLLELGTEVWSMRRRQMVLESLLNQNKVVTRETIEAYEPTPAEAAAWTRQRDDMAERVFAVLTRPATRLSGAPPMDGLVPSVQPPKPMTGPVMGDEGI